VIGVAFSVLVGLSHPSPIARMERENGLSCNGFGHVERWWVNELSNKLKVTYRGGRIRALRLPKFAFANGDFFLNSLLPLDRESLLVTHNQGAYVVNDRGQVLRELSIRTLEVFDVAGKGVVMERNPNPLDYVSFRAVSLIGHTIACVCDLTPPTILFLDDGLKKGRAYCFLRDQIVKIKSEPRRGWLVTLRYPGQRRTMHIDNKGALCSDRSNGRFFLKVNTGGAQSERP